MTPAYLAALATDAQDFAWTEDAIEDAMRNAPAGWGECMAGDLACADVDPHTLTLGWNGLAWTVSFAGDSLEILEAREDGVLQELSSLVDDCNGFSVAALAELLFAAWCDGDAEVVA